MKKLHYVVAILLIGSTITAQKTCESSQVLIEDLNSINKCFINQTSEKEGPQTSIISRGVKLNTASPKKRFLTVRKQRIASLGLFNAIDSKGVKEPNIESSIEVESLIALRKDYLHKVYDFTKVDKIPVFKNCDGYTVEEQHVCFNREMMKFLNENLEYSDAVIDEGFTGEISVKFIIDKNGKTNNIQASGFKEARVLKEEIINIVSKLPVFEPAEDNNRNVPVEYTFLLNFSI